MKSLKQIIGIMVLMAFFACEDDTQSISPVPSPPIEDLDGVVYAEEVFSEEESFEEDRN